MISDAQAFAVPRCPLAGTVYGTGHGVAGDSLFLGSLIRRTDVQRGPRTKDSSRRQSRRTFNPPVPFPMAPQASFLSHAEKVRGGANLGFLQPAKPRLRHHAMEIKQHGAKRCVSFIGVRVCLDRWQ